MNDDVDVGSPKPCPSTPAPPEPEDAAGDVVKITTETLGCTNVGDPGDALPDMEVF